MHTSDYKQFKDRNPDRLLGTCCGKSVLSKSLINKDLRYTNSHATCYFFFKDDNNMQKTPAAAFSALLHQLFSQKQSLIKYALSDHAKEGPNLLQSFHKLWNILTEAANDSKAGEIVCVLDALDECKESGRYDIIATLNAFHKTLKFLITSRPYLDIERRFMGIIRDFPTVQLQGEKKLDMISHKIDIIIKQSMSDLTAELNLNELEKSVLEGELLSMTHRTYLWAMLIFKMIRDELDPTEDRLKEIIKNLPQTKKKLLHIIVAATRLLTLTETNIALAIEDYYQSYEDLCLSNHARFDSTVRNLCGLFVNVIDQKVYLIHQTAKEFLVARNTASTDG
ncbi:hypothetical protein K469DRAFT_730556 [Zopfia rhizophila CBS 207.26]|uniref:NACHT domain-containing protein n=1 Tax=Zopfia rhizophila CBS 207.26 TaxID=1314779 RepID=A0A6A6DJE3_9PEZI|nr:hypothetical protein K469DRAFT_730556 [Zopfia rhizophila CBS 207.26]